MAEPSTVVDAPIYDRKVWVVSNLEVPRGEDPSDYYYREDFRGRIIEVPPKLYDEELDSYRVQKKVLMNFLEARRFLGKAVPPAEPNPDGSYMDHKTFRIDPRKFGKPLKMVELTAKEKAELDPDALTDKQKQQIEEELSAKSHIGKHQGEVEAIGTGKPQAQRKSRGRPSTRDLAAELAADLDA